MVLILLLLAQREIVKMSASFLASSSRAAVEQTSHDPKFQDLKLATTYTRRKKHKR
jgi:hypothetical protein